MSDVLGTKRMHRNYAQTFLQLQCESQIKRKFYTQFPHLRLCIF